MHLVVDAVVVRAGSSAIVVEHLLPAGWAEAAPDDRVTVLSDPKGPVFAVPAGYDAGHRERFRSAGRSVRSGCAPSVYAGRPGRWTPTRCSQRCRPPVWWATPASGAG